MRYLYKETETGYKQLLSAAKEAETEWTESKTIKAKVTSVVDPGKKERHELKAQIDKLTKELNKKEKGSFFKKKTGKGENPTPVSSPKGSPRSKGPEITAHGPFCNGKKPLQCFKCGGWGHVICECPSPGNVNPLGWLIGEANEKQVKLEGQNFKALVDSGSMVSQITNSLAKVLKLPIKQLQTLIPKEGSGRITVPYLGYVEATLNIPEVKAFQKGCLSLVMNDHTYGKQVPIMIGTLHIDMIID